MNLLECQGKQLLGEAGLPVPDGGVATDPEQARGIAERLGRPTVVKAQVPAGRRGKSGGVLFAEDAAQAGDHAETLIGASIGGATAHSVLVEARVGIAAELYTAVLNDPVSRSPLVLFSEAGGMDIEELNERSPERVLRHPVDIASGLSHEQARGLVAGTALAPAAADRVADVLVALYALYRQVDADLLEINPLALTVDGDVVALDCKLSLDPSGLARHPQLRSRFAPDPTDGTTELERSAREQGLLYMQLDGDVGILANGAGLTMATLDAVTHYGGRPANFLEIGGDAYTKATPALALVLANPNVRSLLVNFCGAFARTDVMTEGVVKALTELRPQVPVSFSIHGTGEDEAIAWVRTLGVQPHDLMDDAVREAVANAAAARREEG